MRRYVVNVFLNLLALFAIVFPTLSLADTTFVERSDVQDFIRMMVKKHHFDKQQLITIMSAVKTRPQVIRHINKPLEKEAWKTYQRLFVNEWRIEQGVKFWNKYELALRQAEATYGVPAAIIVATIGIESKYGQRTGDYRVIDSLSSLGFSASSRAAFFRKELEEFLLLSREQGVNPLKVMGSYAGAIGQPQFMPSSYRHYAVNFSGSGSIDLMNDEVDVIGSIANYYRKSGWEAQAPVAVPALIIGNSYHYLMRDGYTNKRPLTLRQLSDYGVEPRFKIKQDDLKVKVIELDSRYSKEYWISFRNFDVIKRYNSSNLYAMAVYQLSQYISELRERLRHG